MNRENHINYAITLKSTNNNASITNIPFQSDSNTERGAFTCRCEFAIFYRKINTPIIPGDNFSDE